MSSSSKDHDLRTSSVFSDPTADIILQSTEGTLYHVHSVVLRTTSHFFRTLLSLPQGASSSSVQLRDSSDPQMEVKPEIIPTHEADGPMDRVLRLMCGLPIPRWTALSEILTTLDLIEKWDAPGPLSVIQASIEGHPLFAAHPLKAYVLAARFGWDDEMPGIARRTLQIDLLSGGSDAAGQAYEEDLCRLSSRSLLRLVTYHDRCKGRFREALEGTELFASGNDEPRECNCGRNRDNYPWRMLKARLLSEFNKRPLGDTILSEMVGWPEAAACWRAQCACSQKYYDHSSTVANIKASIRNAVEQDFVA
ncbi:unnamed protein product [Mycena citricolor]|uniref:BTB domain-containing protein n=1 Tax=Mycena citricolor TaxID=2018698 RepID=A0AAD2HYR7_9AGAR|nr:unnamed protein product [Mycena citricolor]CAK5283741.1 unnamed protein product [Mycena citricolor]